MDIIYIYIHSIYLPGHLQPSYAVNLCRSKVWSFWIQIDLVVFSLVFFPGDFPSARVHMGEIFLPKRGDQPWWAGQPKFSERDTLEDERLEPTNHPWKERKMIWTTPPKKRTSSSRSSSGGWNTSIKIVVTRCLWGFLDTRKKKTPDLSLPISMNQKVMDFLAC